MITKDEALKREQQSVERGDPVAVYVGETWCGSVVRLYEDLPLETPLYTSPQPAPATELRKQQEEPIHVPVTDNTYGYAKRLAESIFKKHFASDDHYASGRVVWGVNDTVIGILTQIDNMVADMVRRPAQQQESKLPEFYARFEDGLVSVYQRREDATPLLLLRENLPGKQPAPLKPLTMQERTSIVRANTSFHDKKEIDAYGIIDDVEAAHDIKENT